MAIDFRLTARQRELQLQSRKFAREVLARALEAEDSAHSRGTVCRDEDRLRGDHCGGIFAEMHSSAFL